MVNSTASYFVGVKGGLVMSVISFSIVFIVITGLVLLLMAMHISARDRQNEWQWSHRPF